MSTFLLFCSTALSLAARRICLLLSFLLLSGSHIYISPFGVDADKALTIHFLSTSIWFLLLFWCVLATTTSMFRKFPVYKQQHLVLWISQDLLWASENVGRFCSHTVILRDPIQLVEQRKTSFKRADSTFHICQQAYPCNANYKMHSFNRQLASP